VSGGHRIKNPLLQDFSVQIAAEVDIPESAKDNYTSRKLFKRLDRFATLGFVAAAQAYADAGIDTDKSPDRYGAIIATGEGGLQTNWDQMLRMSQKGFDTVSPYYIPGI